MKSMASKQILSRSVYAVAIAVALLSAGCGSGGGGEPGAKPAIGSSGSGGANGAVAARPRVTLALTDASGAASTLVTSSKPLTVVATVVDASGKPVVNALTAFNATSNLAIVSPASGTVATDSEGKARITLSAVSAVSAGAGVLEVVAVVGETTATAKTVFTAGLAKLSLKLVTPDINALKLRAYDSSPITFDVLSDGQPLTSESVALSLSSPCAQAGKATLPGTVSTVNGRAQLVYRDQGCTQSDVITATLTGADAALTINVQVASPDAASVQVGAIDPSDRSIVIKGSGGSGRTETATVKFKVVDQFGKPIANQRVTFSLISTKSLTLNKTSDVTDAAGEVVTALTSGAEPTAVRVRATLDNGLSTISDTISVTTGVPIQAAFSLSATNYNFEGFEYDNEKVGVLLLLADQFGNPVADGVPVVFQTDSGAIGTADRGGCITTNGGCTVDLRSQNPRYYTDSTAPQGRAGMATVTVSTLGDTTVPLSGTTRIFLSGSRASNIATMRAGVATPVGGTLALSTNSCEAVSVTLLLSDARRNPMPFGTSVGFGGAVDVGASEAYPSSVLSAPPTVINGRVIGDQGTQHVISLAPSETKCLATGTFSSTASVNVVITTPKGNVTVLPITMNFPSAPPAAK